MRTRNQGMAAFELSVVLALGLVVAAVAIAIANSLLRGASARSMAQETAADMARIAHAVQVYVRDHPEAFAPGVRTPVTMAALRGAGLLPTPFADRQEDGVPRSPLGQPYAAVAVRRVAGKPASAIVYESGEPLPEKLQAAGADMGDGSLWGMKTRVAQDIEQTYQTRAGSILPGGVVAQGPADGFKIDLTGFFEQAPTHPLAVALVNFAELAAGNEGPDDPIPVALGERRKLWRECRYKMATAPREWPLGWEQLGGCGPPAGDSCPDGPGEHWEWSPVVTDCRAQRALTLTPNGLALTNGWVDTISAFWDEGIWTRNRFRRGAITMDNVTMVDTVCETETTIPLSYIRWVNPIVTGLGVCCSYEWSSSTSCTP